MNSAYNKYNISSNINNLTSNLDSLNTDLNKWYDTITSAPHPLTYTTPLVYTPDTNGSWQDLNTNKILKSIADLVYDNIDKEEEKTKSLGKPYTKNNEEENNMFDFGNMFNGMFKQVGRGMCKIGMNGQIAIKTSSGYKTFDRKKMRLVNCTNFAFDMDGAFWVVPTFKVECGDIIMVNGAPCAVIEVKEKTISVFSYEKSTINEILPERHVFMGKTYCYGKIFSPFMNMGKDGGNLMSSMLNMAMMSQMFNGGGNNASGNNMLPMMFMMNGGMGNGNPFAEMFEGAFNFGEETEEDNQDDKEE